MEKTRFMEYMFSAVENNDEELTLQVGNDIKAAQTEESGVLETGEVTYVNLGMGKVLIIDHETGEATVAEMSEEEADSYDLAMVPAEELEAFLHPYQDGVTPGNVVLDNHEDANDRMQGDADHVISPNLPCGGLNPQAGVEPTVNEVEKGFSSKDSKNTAVIKIFSSTDLLERLFSEVLESEQTAVVGNIKIEKESGTDNTVVVTDKNTGDQARVEVTPENMEVTEIEQKEFKNFSAEDDIVELYVVGIQPFDHILVNAPVAEGEDAAHLLADRLEQIGIQGVEIFEDQTEAREYAISLLSGQGVSEVEEIAEAREATFSDNEDQTIYVHRYFSSCTEVMFKMFSESDNEDTTTQDKIEDAIESGDQLEDEDLVITPVSDDCAIVEDKDSGEFTKAKLEEGEIAMEEISEAEAAKCFSNLSVGEPFVYEEKSYSETAYIVRLFSDQADQGHIEDAIKSGEQIENDTEIITPVNDSCAVIEDKETGEFTKAEVDGEHLKVDGISEDEAKDLTDGLELDDRSYSSDETINGYMTRLYSDEANQEHIEDAIESGDQIENETEVITPISKTEAVVEDKEAGEFTKVTLVADEMHVEAIDEDEAKKLTEGLSVEEDKKEEVAPVESPEDKKFSNSEDMLCRLFTEQAPVAVVEGEEVESVEAIEDKASIAVQAIQEAAETAVGAIQEAKAAPAPGAEEDLKEATFSEKDLDGTVTTWLGFSNKQ